MPAPFAVAPLPAAPLPAAPLPVQAAPSPAAGASAAAVASIPAPVATVSFAPASAASASSALAAAAAAAIAAPVIAAPAVAAPVAAAPTALQTHAVDAPARSQVLAAARASLQNGQEAFLVRALGYAVKKGASDLHLHSGAPLLARIHGRLGPLKGDQIITAEEAERFIAEILSDANWQALADRGEVDFAFALKGVGRFRVNAYRQQRGLDIVFRIIPEEVPTIAELGLPETVSKLVDYRTGLVLCTGPSGCGKSTTLASLLRHLIDTREEHVLTIENPIEHVFKEKCSIVNQRQVGDHTSSFARALRAALREDPDVIAITEMRDKESIGLALSAAETGHLVLGTLHTGNAGQTISRIVNTFEAEEQAHIRTQLSESLRAVVSQRLVPKADGSGRALAFELLICNTAVANMIRDDKMFQINSIMQTGKALGMVTLDDSLAELVARNVVSKDEARRFAEAKERFR
jgi:twitching motility protein PilT